MSAFSIGGDLWPGISKLIEECGEVQQVAGKLIGSRGVEAHWDGTNLRQRIEDEMADLYAALQFVTESNDLDSGRMYKRMNEKLKKFREWHNQ